jgi:hypothetical protein
MGFKKGKQEREEKQVSTANQMPAAAFRTHSNTRDRKMAQQFPV